MSPSHGRCRVTQWPALASVIAVLLALPITGESQAGTIDLAAADRVVDSYMRHVVKRLPREWRRAEEEKLREGPPRIPPGGIYQIRAPEGVLAFEHDADSLRLFCYSRIHKLREEYPLIGLSREEIHTALERAVTAGADTGGGELIWEPAAKGFFLRRTFSEPPRSMRWMIKELDRLMAAGEKWSRKGYLEAVRGHARTLRPPDSATGRVGDFRVTIVLTPDLRYQDQWRRPPGAPQPLLVSRSEYGRGEEVWALALFAGTGMEADGQLQLKAQYTFVYPDGSEHGSPVGNLWWSEPPPADHLQMSELRAAIEIGSDKPPGDYLARIKACEPSLQRCVTAETPFRVVTGTAP